MNTEPPVDFVYFDIGKVLFDFDYRRAWDRLLPHSQLDEETALSHARGNPFFLDYEAGKFETPVFFQNLKQDYSLTLSWEAIQEIWNDIFTPLDAHLDAAIRIAERIPTGIISNISDTHVAYLRTLSDIFERVTCPTFSFEVGVSKPDPKIYKEALGALGAVPEHSLFIDDMPENVEAAASHGFQTIHCTPDIDLPAELKRRGLLD